MVVASLALPASRRLKPVAVTQSEGVAPVILDDHRSSTQPPLSTSRSVEASQVTCALALTAWTRKLLMFAGVVVMPCTAMQTAADHADETPKMLMARTWKQ